MIAGWFLGKINMVVGSTLRLSIKKLIIITTTVNIMERFSGDPRTLYGRISKYERRVIAFHSK